MIALVRIQRFRSDFRVLEVLASDGRPALLPVLAVPTPDPPWTTLPEHFGTPILLPDELLGRTAFVTAAGCGVHRVELGTAPIRLPPPIRITIVVPGAHVLPSGDRGIELHFGAQGVPPGMAALLDRAPASIYYRDLPSYSERVIWIDPATRSAEVLLPRAGRWLVRWTHRDRPRRSIGIAFATGETTIDVTNDGERHALSIDPDELG